MVKRIQRRQLFRGYSSQNNNKDILYDIDIVKQDLINHFQTRVGERIMMPTYGCIIWDLLFEPFTENLRDLIMDNMIEIIEADTRLSLDSAVVDEYEHGIVIQASVLFRPFRVVETFSVNFDRRILEAADGTRLVES